MVALQSTSSRLRKGRGYCSRGSAIPSSGCWEVEWVEVVGVGVEVEAIPTIPVSGRRRGREVGEGRGYAQGFIMGEH